MGIKTRNIWTANLLELLSDAKDRHQTQHVERLEALDKLVEQFQIASSGLLAGSWAHHILTPHVLRCVVFERQRACMVCSLSCSHTLAAQAAMALRDWFGQTRPRPHVCWFNLKQLQTYTFYSCIVLHFLHFDFVIWFMIRIRLFIWWNSLASLCGCVFVYLTLFWWNHRVL